MSGAIHFGVPRDTTPEERQVVGVPVHHPMQKVGAVVDLQADKEFPIGEFLFQDEAGNVVPAPAGVSVTYTSNNTDAVVIATADDGLTVARAVGLGAAQVHADATWVDADGMSHSITADELVTVVAGNAERGTIVFGEAREITPDA